jgi:hypothetical protein
MSKIDRLPFHVRIADKEGRATTGFTRPWNTVCTIVEGVAPATGFTAMTGTSDDTTARDTASITTEQLAERVKALEDRLAKLTVPTT